jgi:plasmid stability protein
LFDEFLAMPAILIRNIPEPVQNALRSIAAERHLSVEALVRETLSAFVDRSGRGGIDFSKLQRDRAALGILDEGPAWTDAMDDPALSRRVLGLPDE